MQLLRRETRESARDLLRAVLGWLDAALFVFVMAILCLGWFVADVLMLCREKWLHARGE